MTPQSPPPQVSAEEKARARFCWHCSRKLYGNHFALDKTPDGREVVVHVGCKKAKGDQYAVGD